MSAPERRTGDDFGCSNVPLAAVVSPRASRDSAGITWGPTIRARLADERGRKARTERSLASLKNQTGIYADEHRRLIAMQDEIIAVIERHAGTQP